MCESVEQRLGLGTRPKGTPLKAPRGKVIPFKEIKFWIEKSPKRDYYYINARYLKSPKSESSFGHGIIFRGEGAVRGFGLIFNPEDNKIYGKELSGGGWYDSVNNVFLTVPPEDWKEDGTVIYKEPEWIFYHLGEARFEKDIFQPIFPRHTRFTFISREIADSFIKFIIPVSTMSDLTVHSIVVHFPPYALNELTKKELEKTPSLAEIFKEETKYR